MSALEQLAVDIFGAGSPNVNSVLGKLDNLAKKVAAGDVTGAQEQAQNIVRFVRDKADGLVGTQEQVTQFISGVLCFAGLSPDTFLILPTDAPQVRVAEDGNSGVSLQANTVNVPTLLTLAPIDSGPSPLVTLLDQYPSYVNVTASSPITKPAVVAVCPVGPIPAEVRDRLRLGHQGAGGFEITPQANADFLPCVQTTASTTPKWLQLLASVFVPKDLYAARLGGGVGGSATEFSPFGAVDPVLKSAGGGVGGSATEFARPESSTPVSMGNTRSGIQRRSKRQMTNSSAMLMATVGEPCSDMSAIVGTPLECRPAVAITTFNGTMLTNVPVDWAVTGGGGSIAPNAIASGTCGAFGNSAATTTDSSARASICWTMGPEGGVNSAAATPRAGGDAPPGVSFSPSAFVFNATALKITPVATAIGGNFVFDDSAHAGSGSCSHGLTPVLAYSSGVAPSAVGSYVLTVTCGEGSAVYNSVSATAAIVIAAAIPTVSVSCPEAVVYSGSAQTPCSATVTAPGLSASPTPDYAANVNAGTATASVTFAATGNYAAASGSVTFAITPAPTTTTVSCSPAPLSYTGSPLTPCSATTTGPGLEASTATTYSNNVNAGTATASASYAGGGNYEGSVGSATFVITPASTTTTVSCPVSATFTGDAIEPCSASVAGPGGLSLALAPTYSSNVNVGTATAAASYAGGPNYLISSASATFAIDPAATAVSVTCPASIAYDGAVRNPCAASVTGPALSQSLGVSYTPASPRDAASYVASASYAGGANHLASSSSATFDITKLGATATSGSASINFGAPVPAIPCVVSGLLTGDAGAVSCTTTVPTITAAGTYATTPVVSPPNPTNYSVAKVSGTLTVAAYVQVNCFASPIYNVMPPTKSAQRKGSNLPVKCTLTTPQGAAVTNATGDLLVEDRGTTGTGTPIEVFRGANVFKVSTGGNYAFGLDTSPGVFVVGHYYHVTATWNDGSRTTGWFLLK